MDINKAVRKQIKSYKIFMLSMCFIAILLPLVLFFTGMNTKVFLLMYLIILETLIVLAMFVKANYERLNFQCGTNKLKISVGIIKREYLIFCDKVALVHTEKKEEDMTIIIVTTLRFRNKKIRPITQDFYKKYPYAANEYMKVKKKNLENTYYYIVIKKGGLKKYLLLDSVYRNCVKAVYTDNAIENLRISRGHISL